MGEGGYGSEEMRLVGIYFGKIFIQKAVKLVSQ
jgi:hypothetical protein